MAVSVAGKTALDVAKGVLDASLTLVKVPEGIKIAIHISTDNIHIAKELCGLVGYVGLAIGGASLGVLLLLLGYKVLKPLVESAVKHAFGEDRDDIDLTRCRHPDDIKPYKEQTGNNEEKHIPQPTVDDQWIELDEAYEDEVSLYINRPPPSRRSQRIRRTPQFYE